MSWRISWSLVLWAFRGEQQWDCRCSSLPLRLPNTERHLYKGPSPLKLCFGLSLSDNSLLWWNPPAANTQHDINTVLAHCSHQRCFVVREGQTACFPFILFFFLRHPTLAHPSFLPSGLLWIVVLSGIIPVLKGIVHPKMKILSSFTHPQVVPNLYECRCSAEHKGRYSEECGKQSSSGAPLTSIVFFFLLWKSMVPQNSLVTNFHQNIFLCVQQNK